MSQPDFRTLPPVVGVEGYRWVGSTMMDEEQYRIEGWYLSGPVVKPTEHSYEVHHPKHGRMVVSYWRAPLPWPPEADSRLGTPRHGLRGYAALLRDRREAAIAAARARREDEDEFANYVDSLHDAKPHYRPATTGGDAA